MDEEAASVAPSSICATLSKQIDFSPMFGVSSRVSYRFAMVKTEFEPEGMP